MTDRIYSITEIQTILNPIFARNGVKRAILFGLYGKRNASKKSDLFDVSHIEPASRIEKEIGRTGGCCCMKNRAILLKLIEHIDKIQSYWIIHDYEGVNLYLVWEVIKNDLPNLRDTLIKI